MDVRDKLLFESEYAGNLKEKIAPKSPLRIPWAWLPGALCLLQEVLLLTFCCVLSLQMFCTDLSATMLQVGQEKLVLDIGRAALRNLDSKPYIHDIFLSMALAEVKSNELRMGTSYLLSLSSASSISNMFVFHLVCNCQGCFRG